jgi:hypothetical protein
MINSIGMASSALLTLTYHMAGHHFLHHQEKKDA